MIGVLGGLALIGALIFLIFFYRKRARSISPIPSQEMADDRTSRGSSFMGGLFPRNNGEGAAGGSIPARSGTTFTDRRMKTNTILYPNGARESSVSLQDNEDYSRPVLRVSFISNFALWPNTLANCVVSSLPTPIKSGMTILFDCLFFSLLSSAPFNFH